MTGGRSACPGLYGRANAKPLVEQHPKYGKVYNVGSPEGAGNQKKIVADVEWTFPLDFIEVVWGDGQRTDRQIISTTDATASARALFEIPFDATGKKWVRFAAWDIAGNGALVQPIKLNSAPTSTR